LTFPFQPTETWGKKEKGVQRGKREKKKKNVHTEGGNKKKGGNTQQTH